MKFGVKKIFSKKTKSPQKMPNMRHRTSSACDAVIFTIYHASRRG